MGIEIVKESKFLVKHTTIYAIANLLSKISSFLLLPIYTRFLTPNDYGIKELIALSTDIIGTLLAGLIAAGVMRFYFEYQETKDRNEIISSAIISIGFAGLAGVGLMFIFSKFMAFYLLSDSTLYYYLEIAFVSMWFQLINNVGFEYLRSNQQSVKMVTLSLSKLLLNIFLNIFLICIVKIGVLGILISTLVSSIFIFILLTVPLIMNIGLSFSKEKVAQMAKFSYPLVLSQIGAFVVHLSDRFFIKAMISVADAGLYSLGYRLGTLPGDFISEPFNRTWKPRRYEMYRMDDSERIFGQIFTYYLFSMFFIGLIISVLSKNILIIIADKSFWSAYKIVPIIVLANIIFNMSSHVNLGLLIKKKTKYFAYINLSNSLIVLILNYTLIKWMGLFGAAYATLFSFVYKISLIYYFSNKYYKVYFEFVRVGKILITAILLFILANLVELPSVYASTLLKMGVIFLYPIFLYTIGFFTDQEKIKIFEVLQSRYKVFRMFFHKVK